MNLVNYVSSFLVLDSANISPAREKSRLSKYVINKKGDDVKHTNLKTKMFAGRQSGVMPWK
jgi:hypothetical protein